MYNKLFSKIVTSSIWLEPTPTRIVWLMFIALMNEDGFVQFASAANVAHTARITEPEAEEAINILEGPDPNSADSDNDGRRIEKVPGGWMILNAQKYRDLVTRDMVRAQTRDRVARHRANKRQRLGWNQDECAACHKAFKKPKSKHAHLDHDHKTGRARGLLCQSCNTIAGLIENRQPHLPDANVEAYLLHVTQSNNSVTQSDTDTKKKPPDPLKGERDGFDLFWDEYPNKQAKIAAKRAWLKIKADEHEEVMSGLSRWKQSESWLKDDGQFIPHPATFLNQRRFEDSPKPKAGKKKVYYNHLPPKNEMPDSDFVNVRDVARKEMEKLRCKLQTQ